MIYFSIFFDYSYLSFLISINNFNYEIIKKDAYFYIILMDVNPFLDCSKYKYIYYYLLSERLTFFLSVTKYLLLC